MTMTALGQVTDAARLVAFALTTAAPGRNPDHRDLLDRYLTDRGFADAVIAVADGFGLAVLGATDRSGLILSPEPNTVFHPTTADLTGTAIRTVTERLLLGLAATGLAAYCYPTPASLEREDLIAVIPEAAAAAITEQCERLGADHPDDAVDSEELAEAWRAWLALDEVNLTATGALTTRGSRLWYAHRAIGLLVDAGMLTAQTDGRWLTTDRFRISMRQVGSDLVTTLLRSALKDPA